VNKLLSTLVFALIILFTNPLFANEMQINFARDGDLIKIDGHLLLPYPPKLIFEVLTDYEHMHDYVPDMISSRVLTKEENKLRVEQKGKSGIGPFKFKYEVVRDVELMPVTELKSNLVSGNFKSMRTSTKITPEGDNTRLDYFADMEPDFWVPPLIGSTIMKRQVRRQFDAFVAELVKRSLPKIESEKTNINQ
jgi:ribosome-associated toxin RatA of RatAB toxin-antitoxin module